MCVYFYFINGKRSLFILYIFDSVDLNKTILQQTKSLTYKFTLSRAFYNQKEFIQMNRMNTRYNVWQYLIFYYIFFIFFSGQAFFYWARWFV